MSRFFITRRQDDSGVALVMAMGVALLGIMVAGVVVSMTIIAANDSGRDRVRTAEIHSAEAAVDTTMAILQGPTTPCPGPAFSGLTYGSGPEASTVVVTIDYSKVDAAGVVTNLTCDSSDVLSDVPSLAVISATSTAVNAQQGLQPVRTLEAKVNLTPVYSPGATAAIFSANGLGTSAAFHLEPGTPGESSNVWIDSGDWTCKGGSSQIKTVGSVFLPAGSLDLQNNCVVDGDVWTQNNLSTSASSESNAVSGSITVRSGNLSLSKAITINGSALLGGATDTNLTALGGITANVGASAIPNLTSVGLPQIEWTPATWIAEGFTVKTAADFGVRMDASWSGPDGNSPCNSWNDSTPIALPTGKTVYDLPSSCPGTIDIKKGALALYGDTAIFLNGLSVTTSFTVTSGDGAPHKLWIIVPYSAPTTGSRGLESNSTSIVFDANIEAFLYAPGTVSMNPHGNFRGQIYGGTVDLKNDSDMVYENVGVPGVDLGAGTSSIIGFDVELVNKREVS
ncbi:hypothetical protein [Demequina sp.]|uniref:hypothetical protein n=1 Tax=Demequina sp. TaxID=2050685 RepID=UPI0025C5AC6F|nr:hypothetical protein [Demequina sp.]